MRTASLGLMKEFLGSNITINTKNTISRPSVIFNLYHSLSVGPCTVTIVATVSHLFINSMQGSTSVSTLIILSILNLKLSMTARPKRKVSYLNPLRNLSCHGHYMIEQDLPCLVKFVWRVILKMDLICTRHTTIFSPWHRRTLMTVQHRSVAQPASQTSPSDGACKVVFFLSWIHQSSSVALSGQWFRKIVHGST